MLAISVFQPLNFHLGMPNYAYLLNASSRLLILINVVLLYAIAFYSVFLIYCLFLFLILIDIVLKNIFCYASSLFTARLFPSANSYKCVLQYCIYTIFIILLRILYSVHCSREYLGFVSVYL